MDRTDADRADADRAVVDRAVVVGGGHMGSVIAGRLSDELRGAEVTVVEPSADRAAALREAEPRLRVEESYRPEPGAAVVVLALPPAALDSFASGLPADAFHDATVVSIMAGVRLETLVARLGTARVLRAMPNLAAEVGQSMTMLCPGPGADDDDLARAEKALSAIGEVLVPPDESFLDAGTALVGSGPALVAFVMKGFTDYAQRAGFDAAGSLRLTCQVLRGTADLLEADGTSPEELYGRASTPGGTTERGITCLGEHRVQEAVRDALEKTAARSRELAG
ncbi:pyrroline-5-carboxylate reductase family protein [Streptomyces sp. NPDC087897]|uniref:pyrroline-5-carboxylate reductase family protein n=1 Tax=Streptomyces sp. NPDC087897 TaxID=3365817 RepID=UPI00382E3669